MADIWNHEWERLTDWEASGGRVLHWSVTMHIRSQYAAPNAVCVIFRLAVDPSFDCYFSVDDKPGEGATYLPLYEMTPTEAAQVLQQYKACPWVAVLRSDQQEQVRKEVCRLGRLRQKFDKGAKLMMKRRWWEAGERAVIKSTSSFEIWYSQPEREVPTLDIPSLMWMPHAQNV